MRELAYAVLIAFASYRLWAFIALDTITRSIRVKLFKNGRHRWLKEWWTCPWCAGSWITAGVTWLTDIVVDGGVIAPVLVGIAAASGTALLGGNDDRLLSSDAELD